LIGGAKFRGRLSLVRLLGQCLADRVREVDPPRPQVLLPVPLHASRLRTRGYNQALEIARVVGRELFLPIDHASCIRSAATPPQAGLDERARHRNIRGAFLVPGLLPWRHVAILDDVVTTGSTVAELSRVLRKAGVRRIQVWAVARTP
jgi:ComF family protein